MTKRILVLYTSVGLGHKFIAENIAYHLERAGYNVKLADILEVQSGWLVDFGTWAHQLINTKLPFIWRWLYRSRLVMKLIFMFRTSLAAKNSEKAKQLVLEFDPELVITTQITASAVISYLIQQHIYKGKFAIAFSDYHLHPTWLYQEADQYLANIEEQKIEMEQWGVKEDKVVTIGITLQPIAKVDKQTIRTQLGIPLVSPVILISSGSLGIGVSPKWLENVVIGIGLARPDCHVVIVCGKNQTLKEQLAKIFADNKHCHVVGFYSPMSDLYSIADVFITKPGGLSTAESLAISLPMLITHWLPGQEELNYDYLQEKQLIMPVKPFVKPDQIVSAVVAETNSHAFRGSLANNPYRIQIVQENEIGNKLISAIKMMFHNV